MLPVLLALFAKGQESDCGASSRSQEAQDSFWRSPDNGTPAALPQASSWPAQVITAAEQAPVRAARCSTTSCGAPNMFLAARAYRNWPLLAASSLAAPR